VTGGVRAQWHLAELGGDPDPFAKIIYTTGLEIDLTASEDELAAAWVRLGRTEDRMRRAGVVPGCELKDAGQDCLDCPKATLDPADPLSQLCRLGKDQATVERACQAKTAARLAPLEELAERVGPATEIVADTEELAELLTAVGL
jgi:hypothetical protein